MEAVATKAKRAGNRCFQAGDYEQAQAHYSRGIAYEDALPPQLLAQLYSNRSATRMKLQQLDAAKDDATRATALAPRWGKPHVRLAELYFAKCKYSKAVDELEIALGLGAAAQDHALVADVRTKLDEYRLLKDTEVRRESQNLAYSAAYTTEGADRETMQASAGLREDQDPSEILDKVHPICWNCALVCGADSLRSCAKCHRAKYCSRECQNEDWREFGHRYLCG